MARSIKNEIRTMSFGLRVRGAYVQQPERARLAGIYKDIGIFSVDASSLYPSVMILNNISEESLRARIYDSVIVNKIISLLTQLKERQKSGNGFEEDQLRNIIYNALHAQFKDFVKREKPAKQAKVLAFNTSYYANLFVKLAMSPVTIEDIFKPKTEEGYYLLKSALHPLLEAITWTSPYNPKHNNTIVDYVFHPDTFESKYKNAKFYILDNVYSTKTELRVLDYNTVINEYFKKYILNPYGVMFYKHKDKLADDIRFLQEAMSSRGKVKNEMIVLGQLSENIQHGNKQAIELAEKLLTEDFDSITDELLSEAEMIDIVKAKKIDKIERLKIEPAGDLMYSLSINIDDRNLFQNSAKVFANSGFGIKGLPTFPYSSPLLGNAITTGGKIYGIKVCQVVTSQIIEEQGRSPDRV